MEARRAKSARGPSPGGPTTAACAAAACSRWTTTVRGSTTASATATTVRSCPPTRQEEPGADGRDAAGHFWLLLLYLWLSCAYVAALAFRPFLDAVGDASNAAERSTAEKVERFALTFAFLTSATLGLALGGYWLWHAYLVLTRQTTIEFAMNSSERRRTLHDKGVVDALQRMLGRRDPSWVLAAVVPPPPRRLPPPYCKRYDPGPAV